ncbi:MAG: lysophospholipid acyltransferase family protein [Pseudomonadota bacterium]
MIHPAPWTIRALWHPRYWGYWALLPLLWLLARLPVRWRMRLGAWLGRQMWRRNRKRQKIIEINLGLCFPTQSAAERLALAQASAERAGQALLDLCSLWLRSKADIRRRWVVHGREHLDAMLAQGLTPLIVLPHVVAIDMGAGMMSEACAGGLGPYNPTGKPFLDAWMSYGRTRFGGGLMTRQEGLRRMLKALRTGEAVYYIPDEDHGAEHSVFAPFFGVSKATLPLLGRLTAQGDTRVLPFFPRLDAQSGQYHMHIEAPIAAFPSDAQAAAEAMNRVLENMIRRDPTQYLWSFKLFKTRPEGEPDIYP